MSVLSGMLGLRRHPIISTLFLVATRAVTIPFLRFDPIRSTTERQAPGVRQVTVAGVGVSKAIAFTLCSVRYSYTSSLALATSAPRR